MSSEFWKERFIFIFKSKIFYEVGAGFWFWFIGGVACLFVCLLLVSFLTGINKSYQQQYRPIEDFLSTAQPPNEFQLPESDASKVINKKNIIML